MGFKEAVNSVLKQNYSNFNGRARRSEYWYFVLFNCIVATVLVLLAGIFKNVKFLSVIFSAISTIYSLAVLIPGLAVAIRRLHDTNRSGWYLFIVLIPVVGSIILLVFLLQDSDADENDYGPNPKAGSLY